MLCCGQETWQTTGCSPTNHCCSQDVCDVTAKEALATDYDYWQTAVVGKQKIKHASLSARMSWSVLDVAWAVIHYDTLHEVKRSIVKPEALWSFLSPPNALCLPCRAVIGLISCSLTWHKTPVTCNECTGRVREAGQTGGVQWIHSGRLIWLIGHVTVLLEPQTTEFFSLLEWYSSRENKTQHA